VRITRLEVRDLRRYRALDVKFGRGLTVVRGPNEAGKTTIQRAIELVLTRKCTSASNDLDLLRSWDADPDARPEVTVEFEQEEEEAVRTGRITKSFRGQRGTVAVQINGQSSTDPAQADEMIAEITGVPTEAFYRSTASIRHHEVADLARDEAALRDRLQASISGADRGTSRAKRRLERALQDLNTKGLKNPGRIKAGEDAVEDARRAVEQGELGLAQLERDRDALVSARDRRSEADATLTERRGLLEKARVAERLEAERAVAQERYDRYHQAVEIRTQVDALRGRHPSEIPLPVLRQTVARLRQLDGRMRELRAMLAGEVEVHYEVPTPEPTWIPLAAGGLAFVAVGGSLAVVSLLGYIPMATGLTFGVTGLIVGILLALLGRRQRHIALDLRRQKELLEVEIDRRLRGRSQLEEELRLDEAESGRLLDTISLPDLQSAEATLAQEEDHLASIDRLDAQLEGLIGKEPRDRVTTLRDEAALEIEQKKHALEALGPIAREPRARERLEVEVRDAESAVERARDDEANARARVEANPVDAEQVATDAERLAAAEEQLTAAQRRARVYAETHRSIEHAEQATMRKATRYLERHMASDVDRITGGRYRRIRVDDRSLDMEVWAPERGDWVPLSALSQGTVDLVYIAARIGLVRLVTGDRRPPLIFDDPFVTLDDDRARRAFELLRDLTADFQVIYLTPADRYDDMADVVVELPAPVAADSRAAAEAALVDG
jgi:DNA repair exonuclease SbcCD ATPase subunit